jgi:hypothetical protein
VAVWVGDCIGRAIQSESGSSTGLGSHLIFEPVFIF